MKGLRRGIWVLALAFLISAGAWAQDKSDQNKQKTQTKQQAPAKQQTPAKQQAPAKQPAAKTAPKAFNALAPNSIDKESSIWAGGEVAYQNYSGDISLSQFSLTAAVDYFILDHLAVGGLISYQNLSNDNSASSIAIGPHALYAFDAFADDDLYPFADISVGFAQTNDGQTESGYFFKIGGGVNYAIKPNLGIVGTLHYAAYNLSDYNYSGIELNGGLVGMF